MCLSFLHYHNCSEDYTTRVSPLIPNYPPVASKSNPQRYPSKPRSTRKIAQPERRPVLSHGNPSEQKKRIHKKPPQEGRSSEKKLEDPVHIKRDESSRKVVAVSLSLRLAKPLKEKGEGSAASCAGNGRPKAGTRARLRVARTRTHTHVRVHIIACVEARGWPRATVGVRGNTVAMRA